MTRQNVGAHGETIATSYLKSHGYSIMESNIRTPFGEIDVLARAKDGTIVFIEVRTRNSKRFGSASESITPVKLQHMVKSAEFVYQRRFTGQRLRLDVITIQGGTVTGHLRNIEIY